MTTSEAERGGALIEGMSEPLAAAMRATSHGPSQAIEGRAIAGALGPRPVVVVGTVRDGRANFTPAVFSMPLSYDPPLVALGLKPTSWGYESLVAAGACTVSVMADAAAEAVLWCGSCSGRDTDKSGAFDVAWLCDDAAGGSAGNAADVPASGSLPYPATALTCIATRLVSDTSAGDHRLLVLEVTAAASQLTGEKNAPGPEDALLCLSRHHLTSLRSGSSR